MKRFIAGAALALTAAAAAAQDAKLIREAAAAHGGEIIVQSALFESLATQITKAFNEKYAKDKLSVKVVRIQTGQQANLYDQELRAGKVSGDVMFMVDPGLFLKLARENKLTPYCSSHNKEFRPEALQKDCTHIHVTAYYQYLSYNPELVTGADVPTSWNDLLNPKWKGKISIPDPKVGGGHYYFVFTIYKLFGKEWFEKVRANDPLLTQSHGVTHNQIMAGERLMGVNISVLARRDGPYPGGKGAPVKEAFPKEGGALLAGSMAITKGGPNPAGAKVFIEWATSLEGQKAINRLGHFSLRKDFTSIEGDDLSKIKYHWWDAEEMDKHRDEWTAEAEKILTGN
ncbi:MAG TPA: extracellular solute-binding protein [Burkholderiales bacterium]|nr:extracellular solute-binding protein [Burkholderiales bacterium]